jgi:hypothetical protein
MPCLFWKTLSVEADHFFSNREAVSFQPSALSDTPLERASSRKLGLRADG